MTIFVQCGYCDYKFKTDDFVVRCPNCNRVLAVLLPQEVNNCLISWGY